MFEIEVGETEDEDADLLNCEAMGTESTPRLIGKDIKGQPCKKDGFIGAF